MQAGSRMPEIIDVLLWAGVILGLIVFAAIAMTDA